MLASCTRGVGVWVANPFRVLSPTSASDGHGGALLPRGGGAGRAGRREAERIVRPVAVRCPGIVPAYDEGGLPAPPPSKGADPGGRSRERRKVVAVRNSPHPAGDLLLLPTTAGAHSVGGGGERV